MPRADEVPAVSLLFGAGARPTLSHIVELAGLPDVRFQVSHAPDASPDTAEPCWVELLANGLTFDLSGLAPGAEAQVPQHVQACGFGREAPVGELEAVTIVPGSHIRAGATMSPILRSLAHLACELGRLESCEGVVWHPARSLCTPDYFTKQVTRWLEGGVFPGLGLATLHVDPDGGISSRGLSVFTGQELRIEPELAGDKGAATRLAVRLLHELVQSGAVGSGREFAGMSGEALYIEPSANRRFARVSRSE